MSLLKDILINGTAEMGLSINEAVLDKLAKYYDLLLEGNRKCNLTAILEEKEVAVKHFLDSFSCLLAVSIQLNDKLLDVGTGAGFPGLPLKLMNNSLQVTLLDSLQKRVAFLQETILALQLSGIQAVHGRAEDIGRSLKYREQYDLVTSRAVARLAVLAEYCLPCVKVGGYFIAQKGPVVTEEVNEAKQAVKTLGGKILDIKKIRLPVLGDERSLIVIKKVSLTPAEYPRKAGTPAKIPL